MLCSMCQKATWLVSHEPLLNEVPRYLGAIALSYPPRVRVRAKVKLSAAFFNDESSIITIGGGGYESAIAPVFELSFN